MGHTAPAAPRAIAMGVDAKQGDLAMTRQTTQIRARYARMYAVVIIMAGMAVGGSLWANSAAPQTGIDVSAMMRSIDTSRLVVQTIPDVF